MKKFKRFVVTVLGLVIAYGAGRAGIGAPTKDAKKEVVNTLIETETESETEKVYGEFTWPKSDIAKLIPSAKSNIGEVSWENNDGFVIYVANTTDEDYKAYVDSCWEAGFVNNYQRTDKAFWGDNADGYTVEVRKQDNNIMFIRLDAPEEETETETQTEASTELVTETQVQTEQIAETNSDGIRPEFKEAMDSYEAFFDKYVDFMNNYDSSDVTLVAKYAEYLAQYADMMDKMDKMGDDAMNDAETSYFIKVQSNVLAKLATVKTE